MTWPFLQILTMIYLTGVVLLSRRQVHFLLYIWGALGFAFLFIQLSLLMGWNDTMAALETRQVQTIMGLFGVKIQLADATTLLVPDSTGWSGLKVGIECSTLIELSIFAGLIGFYPRLLLRQRVLALVVGAVGTYALNLFRLMIIIMITLWWGKDAVPFAHAIVARLVYFVGMVGLYWYLLTQPTLWLIHRNIETSGRAVN